MDSGKHTAGVKRRIPRSIIDIGVMIALVVGVTLLVRAFLLEAYEIPSASMETTIMTGDMVLAEKVTYYSSDPKPGEIVTFTDPENSSRTLIKRCIATEGQTITLVDNQVCVDGAVLNEPYTNGLPSYDLMSQNVSYPYTVPAGCIWVMGDNRTSSQDSRYFGGIPISSVKSRGFAIYWPLDRIGLLNQ